MEIINSSKKHNKNKIQKTNNHNIKYAKGLKILLITKKENSNV